MIAWIKGSSGSVIELKLIPANLAFPLMFKALTSARLSAFNAVILSLLSNVGNEWWNLTKSAFSNDFIRYADGKINSGKYKISVHPGSGVE